MAFIAGKNTLSSGTGAWALLIPDNAAIATDDPPTRNPILAHGTPVPAADFALFPTVKLVITLTSDGTTTVHIVGDASTEAPNPPDSIGYTANMEIDVVNDTGHALAGLTFNLTNQFQSLPPSSSNSVVHYGEAVYDANYAYFTMIQPVSGEAIQLFDPNGDPTTSAGAAPSRMVLIGNIPTGGVVVSDSVVHSTELTVPSNNFDLSVSDTVDPGASPLPPSSSTDADIRFQNTTGPVALWQMSGTAIIGGGQVASNPGPTWTAMGIGNFFGIGNGDIVFQNNNGSVALWAMSGTNLVGGGLVTASNPGPAWHIKGTGHFFGDGNSDILFQNNDGSIALWDMSGTNIVGGGLVTASNPGPAWQVVGTGDFFSDGNTDILFQNTNGSVAIWDMSGTSIVGGGLVTASDPGPSWHVKGTGDFYGDGKTDVLFQNDNGSVAIWRMSGTDIIGGGLVTASNPGPTWHIKGTGDFNGDGLTDIVFQNDSGTVATWEMNGTSIIGGGAVASAGAGWNVFDDDMRFIYSSSANETLAASPVAPDEFVFTTFAPGSHTISGFNTAQDIIEFSNAQFASAADVQAATKPVTGGAAIDLGGGSSLLLPGVNPDALHASNFAIA